ncbi:MAG: PAS domain S-box protein [Deltaproteobacteria bacterium]|nr:PAS domain S-box protein [Deltaproteobacteria bacterium]
MLLVLLILAPALFLADLMAGPAIAFGLPDVALVMIAHRLTAGRRTTLAAVVVSVMVVAAPVYLTWGSGGVIPPNVVLGRVVVLLATWMVAALLHERDLARTAMQSHEENFEAQIQRRTGEMRQVNVQLHREINERRRAEHRSRYLASIVESSEDAIIGQSLDGVIVSWNQGATRVYGFDREEMIGQPAARLIPIDREAEMGEFFGRVGRGQRVDPIETQRLRKDGVLIDVSISVSPIIDESGAIVGASLIERDISRRKQAEEALQSLNVDLEARVHERTEELEEALGELETFSYSVSHDLRAPLRAVQGFGAALEEECAPQLSEDGLGLLHRIRAASSRMDQIINDILMLSQASHHRLERETMDLSALARDVVDDFRAAQRERRVEWRIADGVEVWGDPGLMRLVMQNLLGNAFKYSSEREDAVIEFGVEHVDDGTEVLFIRDNGVGFDPAVADTLFEPFQRTHRADDFEGSGIGLATVAKILRRHGGRVWADGEPGTGATFRFQLPSAPWLRRSAAA